MTAPPLIILHRRNRAELLADAPAGAWIEVDVDMREGEPVLAHDPAHDAERLADFLPLALQRGVAGFVFDIKRENAEKFVSPLLAQHKIANYFYLNEMEIQADMFLAADPAHKTAIRIWQYRSACDAIRYAEDMRAAGQNVPGWAWIDCWQRGLPRDIGKAFIPFDRAEAQGLQKLGVKLCLCSPELYTHDYEKNYPPAELELIHRGVADYRKRLAQSGITADAVCTKFPAWWAN